MSFYNAEKIEELYKAGMAIRGIAKELGCTMQTIYRLLATRGVKPDRRGRKHPRLEEMLEMHASGESFRKIAETIGGVSHAQVFKLVRRVLAERADT